MSVAIVTGSSRGIGRAIAERLGADGANVIVNYRSEREAADKVVSTIEASGGQAVAVQGDVSDPAQLRTLFDTAEKTYGGLDILVSNVAVGRFSSLADATDEDFDLTFSTNARATFMALREAARRLRDNGRIVVISSQAAVVPSANSGIYGASKAAGDHLVRAAARELGPRGITVNSVLPGATRTDGLAGLPADVLAHTIALTPLGRLGEPRDIADVVAFLTSDEGRWITGQTIHAGGGQF
ncbi:SDR family oxidoreductase [Streptomyces sp. NPDC059479]|uniref:SDR family oxidoreductase n=1 Tax=Streptomyces sp. NPDC059479 TaxID=3346848 RepID=UPI0036A3D2D7